jgi:repressor LexA
MDFSILCYLIIQILLYIKIVVDTSKHKIDNQIVLAVVNNEYSTIKRFIRDGDMVKLACENGSSEFIFVDSKNVQVIGVVTGFFRNFS